VLAVVSLAACARSEVGIEATPETASAPPQIRIAVVLGARSLVLGGGSALRLQTPDGPASSELPLGTSASVTPGQPGLQVRLSGVVVNLGPSLSVTPAQSGAVRLNGRDYRGSLLVSVEDGLVRAVNLLDVEDYVQGVVGAEMGRRSEPDLAALEAQAVLSRSIALKALGRWQARGYDLVATVADQAYAGIEFENPVASEASRQTRGEALTWQGVLIDGFFHSTCGGRTADGTEVFAGADRPYLRSIRDVDDAGRPWCAVSPRFRWQESWTGEALARTLRENLPSAGGSGELARSVQDLQIVDRTATGRVAHLLIRGRAGSLTVSGVVARLLLRSADGGMLRSASFNLQLTRSGGKIVRLVADGVGAGHGVGMCQWGALARSRAGFSYGDILSAYFPGTQISRIY
jgi:stage II sporulation protein D (peptidoglycan lytic transglycosylase)